MTTRGGSWILLAAGLALSTAACGSSDGLPAEEAEQILGFFDLGLESPDPYVRAETVRAMGHVESPRLQGRLESAASDDSRVVALGANVYLARIDPDQARAGAIDAVTSGEPHAQQQALAEFLAALPPGEVRDEVIDIGLKSPDPRTRRMALTRGAAPRYVAAREGDDARRASSLKDQLSRLVDHPDPILAGEALAALHAGGFEARAQPVIDEASGGDVRALRALSRLDTPGAREALAAARDDGPPEAAGVAAVSLAALGDPSATDGVREVLKGADPQTTRQALLALGRGGRSGGIRIIRPYRDDANPAIREAAYEAMALHQETRGIDTRMGLRDKEARVQVAAMIALCRRGPSELADVLRSAAANVAPLEGGKPNEEGEAAALGVLEALLSARVELSLLGEVKQLEAIDRLIALAEPHLRGILKATRPDVRSAAAELLFVEGDPAQVFSGIEEPGTEVRYAYIDAIARRPPAEEPLRHVEFFRSSYGFMTVMDVAAGAGTWRAYRATATGE